MKSRHFAKCEVLDQCADIPAQNTEEAENVGAITRSTALRSGRQDYLPDLVRRNGAAYLEFMGEADPAPNADPLVGTPEHFAAYERVLSRAAEYSRAHDKRCESFLHPQLIGLEGKRVEVVEDYGDANPRRFYVGKSTGWAPIHLEISRRNSHGGGAVSSRCYRSVRVVGQR